MDRKPLIAGRPTLRPKEMEQAKHERMIWDALKAFNAVLDVKINGIETPGDAVNRVREGYIPLCIAIHVAKFVGVDPADIPSSVPTTQTPAMKDKRYSLLQMLCHSISKKTVDVSAFHIDSEGMYSSDLTMWAELLNALKCVRFKTTAAPSAGIASRPELVTYAAFPAEALAEAATSPVSGRPTLAGRPTLSAAHRPMPALATTPMASSSYATATRDATVMKTGLASPTMMAAGAGGAAATPVAQVRNPDAVRPEPKSVLGMLGAMAKDAASSLFSTDNARLTDIETLSTQWDIQRKSYVDEVNRLAKDNARLVERVQLSERELEQRKTELNHAALMHAKATEEITRLLKELEAKADSYEQLNATLATHKEETQENYGRQQANLEEQTAQTRAAEAKAAKLALEVDNLNSKIASQYAAAELERSNLQATQTALQKQIASLNAQKQALEASNRQLQALVAQREKGESDALRSRDVELARAQSLESLLESTREELESVNAAAVDAADKYEATIAQLQEEAEHARALEAHTAERLQVTHATIVDFKHKLAALSSDTARLLTSARAEWDAASRVLTTKVRQAEVSARDANARYLREQAERRRLYNKLQEAKGNIRVFCRVRPLLAKEAAAGEVPVISATSNYEVAVLEAASERAGGRLMESKSFEFDHVFGADSKQIDLFDEVQPLVTSALDGFHACIFAYGQTGSGKTFTMEGNAAARGIYYRTLDSLFDQIEERAGDYAYSLRVSMVEIYNENVMDLLAEAPLPGMGGGDEEGSAGGMEIKTGPNGNHIPDATILDVTSASQIESIMARGALNRSVGRTNANEHSSRSHSLLMIDLYGTSLVNDSKTYGRLVLVDLAGSERVSKSGAEGVRLKEAQNINKSLSALGDVIQALSTKAPYVPFRNSKLTWLLADSLGKDNKTLMIVQVSPVASSRQETLCSLNFASRVRRVELGKAVKHADAAELGKAKAELRRMQEVYKNYAADMSALKESLTAATEAEAAARARAAEVTARLAAVERDAGAAGDMARELESLRAALRAEREATAARAEEVERLHRAVKEANKVSKAAASAATESAAAKSDMVVKKALEDAATRAKMEQKRAVQEAEAAVKAEAEKSVAALRRSMKEAVAAAEAKAKADVAAAVEAARAQWERDARKAAIVAARTQRASTSRGLNARRSVSAHVAYETDEEGGAGVVCNVSGCDVSHGGCEEEEAAAAAATAVVAVPLSIEAELHAMESVPEHGTVLAFEEAVEGEAALDDVVDSFAELRSASASAADATPGTPQQHSAGAHRMPTPFRGAAASPFVVGDEAAGGEEEGEEEAALPLAFAFASATPARRAAPSVLAEPDSALATAACGMSSVERNAAAANVARLEQRRTARVAGMTSPATVGILKRRVGPASAVGAVTNAAGAAVAGVPHPSRVALVSPVTETVLLPGAETPAGKSTARTARALQLDVAAAAGDDAASCNSSMSVGAASTVASDSESSVGGASMGGASSGAAAHASASGIALSRLTAPTASSRARVPVGRMAGLPLAPAGTMPPASHPSTTPRSTSSVLSSTLSRASSRGSAGSGESEATAASVALPPTARRTAATSTLAATGSVAQPPRSVTPGLPTATARTTSMRVGPRAMTAAAATPASVAAAAADENAGALVADVPTPIASMPPPLSTVTNSSSSSLFKPAVSASANGIVPPPLGVKPPLNAGASLSGPAMRVPSRLKAPTPTATPTSAVSTPASSAVARPPARVAAPAGGSLLRAASAIRAGAAAR